MNITITPDETVSEQLTQLSQVTQRTPGDLILAMIEPTLDQLIAGNDTHLLQAYQLE